MAQALKAGYGSDSGLLVYEMGAKLAAGKFAEIGVSGEAGLKLLNGIALQALFRIGTTLAE